ncbi:sulfite oxidase heme-binding subunit YedZ [Thalassospira mesophila]|uniref:Protein-methionine-sulfoxide reductase heme-binding subunit MsrQ n=1 Tax=Thalassospira mesophila TaxID=1293891 RepID=A0A1Y2L3G2_9PROT|nr:protein-methionine-sulfoxide reductase heme-binding subunit MsrQ [Thalassospira mesophila]OSQ38833.1 ferric reductase [Thalassospira mesophila]
MFPWLDHSGRFSTFKLMVFVAILIPGCVVLWPVLFHEGVSLPIKDAIHGTGDWAIRMLLISLAITPLRRVTKFTRVVLVRRMVGLAAMGYALCHLLLYFIDQSFDVSRIATEILVRIYLTIGFVAVMGLVVLGVTSTNGMMRRLGRNWGRLHKASYGIAVLGILHFFMQSKLDVTEATLMAGFYLWLMLSRFASKMNWKMKSPVTLLGLAVAAALGTAAIEYAWFAIATGVPPLVVLQANLQWMYPLRPAWDVLIIGLLITAFPLVKQLWGKIGPQSANMRVGRARAASRQT